MTGSNTPSAAGQRESGPSNPRRWHGRVAAAAAATEKKLQIPHGGKLQQLLLSQDQVEQERASCSKSMELSDRNACDVELLCVGYAKPSLCQQLMCCSVMYIRRRLCGLQGFLALGWLHG